jgi:hypothetical protein
MPVDMRPALTMAQTIVHLCVPAPAWKNHLGEEIARFSRSNHGGLSKVACAIL